MSVLHDTIVFMRMAERLVIGKSFKPRHRFAIELVDAILHAPCFILAGLHDLLYTAARGIALILLWWLLLYLIDFIFPAETANAGRGLLAGAVLLGVGSVLFGLPSGSIIRRVREEHVSELASHLISATPDDSSMTLLRQGVEKVETAGQQRLSAISWMLGIAWAILVWVASNWVFASDTSEALRNDAASYGLLGLIIFLFFAAAFVSYREAHRILCQTTAFAFLEAASMKNRMDA